MRVAVCIVGFRNAADIANCLTALSASAHRDFQVVICENGGQAAFGHDQHERRVETRRIEDLAEGLGADEVGSGVDEDDVGARCIHELCRLGGNLPDAVAQEFQGRQNGTAAVCGTQDEQLGHAFPLGRRPQGRQGPSYADRGNTMARGSSQARADVPGEGR